MVVPVRLAKATRLMRRFGGADVSVMSGLPSVSGVNQGPFPGWTAVSEEW
ncbi:hypothetical protein GCM10028793_09860 [Nocardiopsis oceani]